MDAPNTSQLPFVSAVCITGKSKYHVEKLLPMAIKSFKEQTYPAERRRLIVLCDDHHVAVQSITEGQVPGIHAVFVDEKRTLGALRNAGLRCAAATGSPLVIQWDDDDWHHPRRIEQQVGAFVKHGGRPCFFKRQLCYDVQRDVAFVREFPNTFIHGSILHANTPDLKPYPEQGKEEDTLFLQQWPEHLVMDNAPELYVRFFHGDEHNTWDRAHVMREAAEYRSGTWAISQHQANYLEEVLSHYEFPVNRSPELPPVGGHTAGRLFDPEDFPILKTPDDPPSVHLPDPPQFREHYREAIALIEAPPPVHVPPPDNVQGCASSRAKTACASSRGIADCMDIPVLTAEGPMDGGILTHGRQDGPAVVPRAEDEQGSDRQEGNQQRRPFVM